MELSYSDFAEFFREKQRGTYACVFCGNQYFQPILNGVQMPAEVMTPINPPPGLIQAAAHHYFGMVCTNCGRTDLFHINILAAWKVAKGKV